MKDGELIVRNGIEYEWIENLPCRACCFMATAVDECVANHTIPFCENGGWKRRERYDLYRFLTNGDGVLVGRFKTKDQAERKRDNLLRQNPTGEYEIYEY